MSEILSSDAVEVIIPTQRVLPRKECCICLDKIVTDDVASLSCGHDTFHFDCIVAWAEKSPMCPMCRHPVCAVSLNGNSIIFKKRKVI